MLFAQLLARLRFLVATPVRQAYSFAAVGIVGLLLGGAGLLLATSDGNGSAPIASDDGASPTASATIEVTPTRTATRTPTPTRTPSPTPTEVIATRAPLTAAPTAVPAPPTPTEVAVVAGGPYCPSVSATAPPTTVGGTVLIGGVPPAAGTVVALAFDGVGGPSGVVTVESTASGLKAGYAIRFSGGPSDCANRVGSAISVVIDGTHYATGRFVGDGAPFIRLDING